MEKKMDFNAKTYLSKSFVYQIFSGERNPGRDILLRIAFAMNLTLAETQELLMMGQKGALYPQGAQGRGDHLLSGTAAVTG